MVSSTNALRGEPHDICQKLVPSFLDTIINTTLFALLFSSRLPQYIRIISRRSTGGISPLTIILGLIFNTFLASTQLYHSSSSVGPIECCRPHGCYGPNGPGSDGSDQHLSGFKAWGVLLALCQVGALMLGSLILLILFLIFPPRFGPLNGSTLNRSSIAILFIITPFLLFTAIYFASALYYALEPKRPDNGLCCRDLPEIISWITSMMPTFIFGGIQYIPQINCTKKSKGAGSLSVIALLCQMPALVAMGISLGLRAWRAETLRHSLPDNSWYKFMSFVFGGFEPWMTSLAQVVMLCILGRYWWAGRGKVIAVESEDDEIDEETPMLGGDQTLVIAS